MLKIHSLTLGPAITNTYIVANETTQDAVVIDPSWDGHLILAAAKERGWRIANIWLTHAHFDHFGGAAVVADALNPPPPVALHPADYRLWRALGGAGGFGIKMDPGPEPSIDLVHGQQVYLGDIEFDVRHAPGHSPGSVIFYCEQEQLAFSGDVVFRGSIGRTDLPLANYEQLMASIESQILSLPDETQLLVGHGPETTVGAEKANNPFLQGLG